MIQGLHGVRVVEAEGTSKDLVHLPRSKQVQLEQVFQGHVRVGFEYFQGWKLTTSVGNLFQCLTTLTGKKSFFIYLGTIS